MARRQKISTTLAVESYAYLYCLVAMGKARNLAEALDLALARVRRAEQRARLEQATASYFAGLTPEAEKEESGVEAALDEAAGEIDFDRY